MKITLEGSPKELKEFLSPNVDARKLWKQIKTSALQPMSEKQYSKWIKSFAFSSTSKSRDKEMHKHLKHEA